MKIFSLLLLTPLLVSCATTHFHNEVQSVDQTLKLSCGEDTKLSKGKYLMLVCSIENMTYDWLAIKAISAKAKTNEGGAKIVSPQDTSDYVAAIKIENAKQDYNTSLLLSGLMIAGSVAASHQKSSVSNAGVLTAAGSASLMAGKELNQSKHEALYAYGPHHLLGRAHKVPAKMHTQKVILVEKKNERVKLKALRICLKLPAPECLILSF